MDNDNINFSSKDIKKKDLDFTVKEKKSTEINNSVKGFWGKIAACWKKFLASPLMKGWHKFITLGVAALIIAAAITLPIFLPELLHPEPTPEEQEKTDQEVQEKISDLVNNIDPDASDETRDAILATIAEHLAAARTDEAKFFLYGANANALAQFGMHDDAIANLQNAVEIMKKENNFPGLVDTYSFIAFVHEESGDKTSAIEYYRLALEAAKSAADSGIPLGHAVTYYANKITTLENN